MQMVNTKAVRRIPWQPACLALVVAACTTTVYHAPVHSAYAGQEQRSIKSLSADDLQQLRTGGGWGLAKAAELNGMPGPKHVLELNNELALDAGQKTRVQELYDDMKSRAVPLGTRLIELEKMLNDAFASGSITPARLRAYLERIAQVHAELRYVHLVAHLQTPQILSAVQLEQYRQLRGYNTGDPCQNIPPGHDASLWLQHNGCN